MQTCLLDCSWPSLCSHMMEETRNLSEVSFIRKLIPFLRATPLLPRHLPKIPLPNIITLGVKIWAYDLGVGGTNIQSIASFEFRLEDSKAVFLKWSFLPLCFNFSLLWCFLYWFSVWKSSATETQPKNHLFCRALSFLKTQCDSCLSPPTSIVSLVILFLYLLVYIPHSTMSSSRRETCLTK